MNLKKISSNGHRIIASGSVMGFENSPSFDIELENPDDGFETKVLLSFVEDENEKNASTKVEIEKNNILIKCFNFNNEGVGMTKSVEIATLKDGKKIYFRFSARNMSSYPVLTYSFFEE